MTLLEMPARTDTAADLELMLEHTPRCESRHRSNTGDTFGPCSVEVVARWSATCPRGRALNICERAAQFVRDVFKTERHCAGCGRLARECWTLRPI